MFKGMWKLTRCAAALFVLASVMTLAAQTTTEHHDKEFWRAIMRNENRLPAGESAGKLIDELNSYLGSPDPELRDTFAYDITATWIYRDNLLSPDEIRRLLRSYESNLKVKLGNREDDSVLLRSFSALSLSTLAAFDNKQNVLSEAEYRDLLTAALEYMKGEQDLRGYDPQKGWMHATAHTADLLKFLGRNPRLQPDDQHRILDAIGAKLGQNGHAFIFGENERMAAALLSLVKRKDFDQKYFETWLAKVVKQKEELWARPQIDVAQFAAVQNTKDLLRSLFVQLRWAGQAETKATEEAITNCLKQLG